MVIGAFVRGLSMRDIESLCEKAGLGKLSKSTAQRICTELRERFEAFKRHDLYDVQLAALFVDAVFLSVRPEGPRRACWSPGASPRRASACFCRDAGDARVPRGLAGPGARSDRPRLGAPMLIVADGAPGLIKAIEQCWPSSDRQHCAVHRVRNLLAKLPERERERVRGAYWQALDEAINEQRRQSSD